MFYDAKIHKIYIKTLFYININRFFASIRLRPQMDVAYKPPFFGTKKNTAHGIFLAAVSFLAPCNIHQMKMGDD
jgi:hypothetical protein